MREIGAGLADGKTKGAAEYILAGKGYKGQGAAWGPSWYRRASAGQAGLLWYAGVVYKWENWNRSRNGTLHTPLEVEIRPRGGGCELILRAFLAKRGSFLKY